MSTAAPVSKHSGIKGDPTFPSGINLQMKPGEKPQLIDFVWAVNPWVLELPSQPVYEGLVDYDFIDFFGRLKLEGSEQKAYEFAKARVL